MEAIDYCSTLRTEVNSWKSKTHEAFARLDEVPVEEMEKLRPFLSELKTVFEEHTARLENLSKECPAGFAEKKPESGKLKSFWQRLGEGEYQWYRPHL
jgi:hypothetical protein